MRHSPTVLLLLLLCRILFTTSTGIVCHCIRFLVSLFPMQSNSDREIPYTFSQIQFPSPTFLQLARRLHAHPQVTPQARIARAYFLGVQSSARLWVPLDFFPAPSVLPPPLRNRILVVLVHFGPQALPGAVPGWTSHIVAGIGLDESLTLFGLFTPFTL